MTDFTKRIEALYKSFETKHAEAREHFDGPLTLAEKILASHMKKVTDEDGNRLVRKQSYAQLFPDRVAMQDATAQMALLQFINAKKSRVAVPSTVHCDHLIAAEVGAKSDLATANKTNEEVYNFLSSASNKYGIGFWKPGSGIIHQVVLENYAFPGGLMVGTDSHTPNGGGLGMCAIGVGGADATDVMLGLPLNLKWPGVIGVQLTGELNGWASAKDVILKLMGILTVKGGTGSIVEFFGDGCASVSATGKGTICNMGAEHGATTSVFPYDPAMAEYLHATDRGEWADLANQHAAHLRADDEVLANPERYYDRVVEIDLSTLEPHIVGPHSPDLARPVSAMKAAVQKEGYPDNISAALIGSCTNSSYQDMGRSASLATSASDHGVESNIPFFITPGSDTVDKTIDRDGQAASFEKIGGTVLANACGPCIGQWHRRDVKAGTINSIVSSYNRNFPGRNDGSRQTLSFLASPEIVTAMALAGSLSFDPQRDSLTAADGSQFKLPVPTSDSLPKNGFVLDRSGFIPPAKDGSNIEVNINPASERLAFLEEFDAWYGDDFYKMPVLLKARGKCTTDHISMAGKWLRFRGHLDQIANNTYIGAVNAFTENPGTGFDHTDPDATHKSFPEIARNYKAQSMPWLVIGDENFGEGSSREHAAMQPRHLGGKAILSRSFARIHETNLKKHGMLPLTFNDPTDYEKIKEQDLVSITGVKDLTPGSQLTITLHHSDGSEDVFKANHTMSEEQVKWFQAGSALNHVANK